jgi:hypothetical protein
MAARGVANGIAAFNAFGFTYVGVRLIIGHLPDRLRTQLVAFWSALVEAIGLVVVAVATNLPVVIVGGLIMGAGLIASLSGYPAIYFVMAGCAVASAMLSLARARAVRPQPG